MTRFADPTSHSSAALLGDDSEAIAAAHALAAEIAPGAAARDAERVVPWEELAALGRSGLLGITVPPEYGGAGVSRVTVAEVFRIIGAADPAIAQTPQAHFGTLETIRLLGSQSQHETFYAAALQGLRFANAAAERGTPNADVRRTRLVVASDGTLRLQGVKYYSTGALTADWINVIALDSEDRTAFALVPADAAGLERHDDWRGFGQRISTSGTTVLNDVEVDAGHIVPGPTTDDPAYALLVAAAQLVHTAIDVGIARGAFEDGVAYVQERARPASEAKVERATEEPHVIVHIGRLATRLGATEALLRRAAETLDELLAGPPITASAAAEALLTVWQAKAFAAESSLQIAAEVLEAAGASATDERFGLDRHWRNARTHTLHDPVRWKLHHIGAYTLSGTLPPLRGI